MTDFSTVEAVMPYAKAMHFDGCHKIYLSMDDAQVGLMREYGYGIEVPDLEKLKGWYEESCGLRFVQSVRTVTGDPNEGFDDLIPQFDGEDDAEDEGWEYK